jgi:cytochrome b6-f complex iron-sulfur subunit
MKRREALQRIVLASGTVLIIPTALLSCAEEGDVDPGGNNGNNGNNDLKINMDDANYSDLKNAGSFVIASGVIVANSDGNNYVALSSICTHQACTVGYSVQNNNFPCPCHGSVFNSNGSVANGPATQPLKQYTVSREGNILTIK